MGGSSAADIQHHVKIYYRVFAILAVLTVVTVGVARLAHAYHWSLATSVTVALIVALIKGSLVACYFMHLISEKGMIFWILALCVVFFVVILAVPSLTEHETLIRSVDHPAMTAPAHGGAAQAGGAGH